MEPSSSSGSPRDDVSSYSRPSSMIPGNSLHICVKFAQASLPHHPLAQQANSSSLLPLSSRDYASVLFARPSRPAYKIPSRSRGPNNLGAQYLPIRARCMHEARPGAPCRRPFCGARRAHLTHMTILYACLLRRHTVGLTLCL